MKRALKIAAVAALILGAIALIALKSATVVRQVKKPEELKADGVALRTRTADALDYSVAIDIAAPAPIVWALLTNAAAYPQWCTTVVKIEGTIAKAETFQLVTKSAPDRPVTLRVNELEKNARMVWEDKGLAVRRFRSCDVSAPTPCCRRRMVRAPRWR
jgi:hypothetical protein